ncbi:MAG: undecaprenyl-phosphate galactosephosphotransferase [Sediminibacterium sp.]|nr:undecaprenyl-phosphate galactosephosphotransferase [Sediminibacterium sp.]
MENHSSDTAASKPNIALVNIDPATRRMIEDSYLKKYSLLFFNTAGELVRAWKKQQLAIVIIIAQVEVQDALRLNVIGSLQSRGLPLVPILLFSSRDNRELIPLAVRAGVTDIFNFPLDRENIELRVDFLVTYWKDLAQKRSKRNGNSYRVALNKRLFDILFAGFALLLLSPLLLLIYIWIRLESKGPAFYYSFRVGSEYRIFRFYKFRSMFTDADKRLKELKHLNMYQADTTAGDEDVNTANLCDECRKRGTECRFPLYADEVRWCEKEYSGSRRAKSGSAFLKFKDDPRITRAGKFIRNTSIDELPQLWNVIIGDMSIVGNRPLPLYEAEKLTTDKYAPRFMAPAGITGLWQVEKRGKGEMSEEERLMLDNIYAANFNLWYDLKLILKTIPALFQKENV